MRNRVNRKIIIGSLLLTTLSILLTGCQKNQGTYRYGSMAGTGQFCDAKTNSDITFCSADNWPSIIEDKEVLSKVRRLVKSKKHTQAELMLKEALAISKKPRKLKFSLVEIYIRQEKWSDALSLINELGVEVNDPLRLTIEARAGQFSAGTNYNLLPQIYRNKLNHVKPLRATVIPDALTYFKLTRVDNAAPGVPSMEPSIKVSDDGQNILVAWMDHINFPNHHPWHQKGRSAFSSDGGDTWSSLIASPGEKSMRSLDLDLITAYDPNNNYMYVSGVTWSQHADSIYVFRLNLNDSTQWGPFLIQGDVVENFPVNYDKGLIAIDDHGGLYLTTYIPGTVKFSDDFGETFTNVPNLPHGMAQPRVKDNCLYLISQISPKFWRCNLSQNAAITTPASDNWWGYEDKVSGTFQVHNLSYMDFHPNGDIFIIFSELKDTNSDELVIWMSKSEDNGDTWDDAWIVTPDFAGDKFLPWIEIDQSGGIHISYVDTRNNPQPDDATVTYLDTYYSYSADHGQTWMETRVTPTSFELIDNVSYRYTYSDYNEMAVGNPDAVFLSFPWSADGNDMNMYVAKKLQRTDLIYLDGFEPIAE